MNPNAVRCSLLLLAGSCANLVGQSRPVVMSAGYDYPNPLYLAPGQLVTLFVQGISVGNDVTRALGDADLPTSLAGVSVGMIQSPPYPGPPGPFLVWRLPIVEVRPFYTCFGPTYLFCPIPLVAVTVQVPFEMLTQLDSCGGCPVTNPNCGCAVSDPDLGVAQDGQSGYAFAVTALPDRVHILKFYDAVLPVAANATPTGLIGQCGGQARNAASAPDNVTGLPCPSVVTHSDGSVVSVKNPAKAGEELVAYAVGLGRTSPPSKTGAIVTSSTPTVTTFTIDFNYRPNALPTRPPPANTPGVGHPLYTGSTPGSVGLYQINFQVPPIPPGTPPCVAVGPYSVTDHVVYSNLTVSIGGRFSFDGAEICVAVDPPDPSPASPEKEGTVNK